MERAIEERETGEPDCESDEDYVNGNGDYDDFTDALNSWIKKIGSANTIVIATILAIILQATSNAIQNGFKGVWDFSEVGLVFKFIVAPFVMLIAWRAINNQYKERIIDLESAYRECRKKLEKSRKLFAEERHNHEINLNSQESQHKVELSNIKSKYELEIVELKVKLNISDDVIEKLEKELKHRTSN